MPEVSVVLGKSKTEVGRLWFEADQNRQFSSFEYSRSWLANEECFAISPELPLQIYSFHKSANNVRDAKISSPLHGCFHDASPDSWGRLLLRREMGGYLTEFDYLTLIEDRTRQGALRFIDDGKILTEKHFKSIPPIINIESLKKVVTIYEENPEKFDEDPGQFSFLGASIGGARPKADVDDNGNLWIAKFTSIYDNWAVERAEIATLKLAKICGLYTPECRLELQNSPKPVALIKRFDRQGDVRIPYMSAKTALNTVEEESYYTSIADVIREISSSSRNDLRELWSRIVFTILVSNTDDHLKNHGFIYSGRGHWKLSPMFDVNPTPKRQRQLKTGIIEGYPFDSSIRLALEASYYFDYGMEEARKKISEMANIIHYNWQNSFREIGAPATEINSYKPAFEHSEMELALCLS